MSLLRRAAAVGALGLLAACGPGNRVVLETPAKTVAPTAGDDAPTACLHRFDKVAAASGPAQDAWDARGGAPLWRRIGQATDQVDGTATDSGLARGYLAASFDSAGNRIVVLVDPSLVDRDALQRRLNLLSAQVQKAHPVSGPPIRIAIFAGCFPADQIVALRQEVRAGASRFALQKLWGPGLDSRTRVTVLTGRSDAKAQLEQIYGSMVDVAYGKADQAK
ncbi:MAG TPA: hypothetical protein VE081_05545 [Sporichthyaceae bacterium]|nr:hypothetical protein [Sporichthyaceae bacterium]